MPEGERSHPSQAMPRLNLMVALCVLFSMASRGMTETFTVFLLPLVDEFRVDRASVTAVFSVQMLCGALAGPMVGHLFDRFGVLRLYLAGLALLVGGLLLAATADSLWQLFLGIGLCTGTASAALGAIAHGALLARWFEGRPYSRNMSIVYAGFGFGSLMLVPLSQWLIGQYGWRNAYLVLAVILLVVLSPAFWLVNWRRAQAGSLQWQARSRAGSREGTEEEAGGDPGPSLLQAIRMPTFWGLAAVFFFTSNGMFSVTVQAVAYLVEKGFPPLQAASIYGLVGMLTPIGVIGFSWLDGRIGRFASVVASYILSLAGLMALFALEWWPNALLLWGFVLCVGFSFGARAPMVASTAARIFQGRQLGLILGSITLGAGTGVFSGSLMGAVLHDITGGYVAVFSYSALSLFLGMLPFLTIRVLRQA